MQRRLLRTKNQTRQTDYAPWVTFKTIGFSNSLDIISQEIVDLYDYTQASPEAEQQAAQIKEHLERTLRETWPNARVFQIGSSVTGLSTPISDLDFTVLTMTSHQPTDCVFYFGEKLKDMQTAYDVRVISRARVPVVKFMDISTKREVDITFNNNDGQRGTRIIRKYLLDYPEAKYIIVLIKLILKQNYMNETYRGGIGSFLLFCLVISSLQQHPGYYDNRENFSLGHYLMHFFRLFGSEFEFERYGISIQDKGRVFLKSEYLGDDKQINFMYVQSPLDSNCVLGGGACCLRIIRMIFNEAYTLLKEWNINQSLTPLDLLIRR